MPKERILVFGAAKMTLALITESLASSVGLSYESLPSGQGENLSIALARLEASPSYFGAVGDDANGKKLARLLADEGVDLTFLSVDKKEQTRFTVMEKSEAGESRTLSFGDRLLLADPSLLEEALYTGPSAVILTGELPAQSLTAVKVGADGRRIPLFFSLTAEEAATPPSPEFLCGEMPFEIFFPDLELVEAWTGIRPTGANSCLEAVVALQKKIKAKYYVFRLSDRGAYIYDGTHCHMVSAYLIQRADLRGGKDAFFAAMVLEYLRGGGEILSACAYAAAAEAIAISREGEALSMPTESEVLSFLERL